MDDQVFLQNFDELKKTIIQNADYDLKKNDSKLDLENLNSAINGRLILKGFGEFESELDLTTFDWVNGSSDRNWWWQIQALPFLNWYIGYYDLTTAEEKTKINEFVKKSVFNWIEKSEQEIKSPLLWHDHATAFRLKHLVRWINFLVLNDLYQDYISIEEQKTLLDLVQKHVEFLNLEENYSKHTNHGFDQMLIVYTVSLLWSNIEYLIKAGELAEKRLEEELDFAFTHQGVHVENSPGYQKFMLSRIELLTELKELGDDRLSKKAFDLIERAKKFLEVITMPNGYIPMIGDTKGDDKGLSSNLSEQIEFYDYSESGYYIAKGLASDGKAVHLVFKCAHMSNYHRHDDDLSFHLFYDDEVIFGDGGLGFYQEKDERRIFLRSSQAHNTVFPLEIDAIRVPSELIAKPTMKVLEPGLVVAETSVYGGRLQRVLDIRNLKDFEMIIQDRWLELPGLNSDINFNINFFIPKQFDIKYLNDECLFVTSKNNKVVLKNINEINNNNRTSFYVSKDTYISNKFAEFDKATNFGWTILTKNKTLYKTIIKIKKNIEKEPLIISDIYNDFAYITDSKNRKMYYQFTPAKEPSNAPLLVILHGHTFNAKPSKYKNEDWNILCPIDNFGVNNAGSWWLGEKGDFFVKDLLQTLIFKIRNDINSNKGLFFWGSSMGGYGALLHGMMLNAKAIYANIPQIKLLGSSYSEKNMKKFFEPIFGTDENSIFNDVTNFLDILNPQDNPLFFLVQSRFDYKNYLEEQGLYFLQKCKDNNINISFEIVPENGHKVFYSIDESVKKLEKYIDIMEEDIKYKKNKNESIDCKLIVNKNKIFVKVLNSKNELYCFYLMHMKERIDVRWYEFKNYVVFEIDGNIDINNCFVKIFKKTYNKILKKEIFFNNNLNCEYNYKDLYEKSIRELLILQYNKNADIFNIFINKSIDEDIDITTELFHFRVYMYTNSMLNEIRFNTLVSGLIKNIIDKKIYSESKNLSKFFMTFCYLEPNIVDIKKIFKGIQEKYYNTFSAEDIFQIGFNRKYSNEIIPKYITDTKTRCLSKIFSTVYETTKIKLI